MQYLAGLLFHARRDGRHAAARAGERPLVIMNAATSAIVTKSPLVVRTSFTLWQTSTPIAKVAKDAGVLEDHLVSAITARVSMRRTHSRPASRRWAAENRGGDPHAAVRPTISRRSCSASRFRCRRRLRFLPSGPTTLGFVKAFNENGLKDGGINSSRRATSPGVRPAALGDAALGLQTTFHYAVSA